MALRMIDAGALRVGQEVVCHFRGGTNATAKGLVFCYDNASDCLVLEEPYAQSTLKQDVRLIKASLLEKIELAAEAPAHVANNLPDIPKTLVAKREKEGVEEAEAVLRRVGKGVTPEAQRLFDELDKTYRLTWHGKNMICIELDILIKPPYGPENCAGKDPQALERIKKVIGVLHQRLAAK